MNFNLIDEDLACVAGILKHVDVETTLSEWIFLIAKNAQPHLQHQQEQQVPICGPAPTSSILSPTKQALESLSYSSCNTSSSSTSELELEKQHNKKLANNKKKRARNKKRSDSMVSADDNDPDDKGPPRHILWGHVEEIEFQRSFAVSAVPSSGIFPIGVLRLLCCGVSLVLGLCVCM